MFISSNEKQSMLLRIESLEGRVNTLARSLNAVLDQLSTKETKIKAKVTKAQREKRNAYASAYYHRKKAEKAAATQTKSKE